MTLFSYCANEYRNDPSCNSSRRSRVLVRSGAGCTNESYFVGRKFAAVASQRDTTSTIRRVHQPNKNSDVSTPQIRPLVGAIPNSNPGIEHVRACFTVNMFTSRFTTTLNLRLVVTTHLNKIGWYVPNLTSLRLS